MPQRVEYNGVIHEFPDDFTPDEISSALSAQDTPPLVAAHKPERLGKGPLSRGVAGFSNFLTAGMGIEPTTPQEMAPGAVRLMNETPQIIGGAVGGLTKSPPLAGMAAGVTQGGVDLLTEPLTGLPAPPLDERGSRAMFQGLLSTTTQGGINLVEGAAKAASPYLMKAALRVSPKLEKLFPNLAFVREAIQRNLKVNPGDPAASLTERAATSSSGDLQRKALESASRADELLAQADRQTTQVPEFGTQTTKTTTFRPKLAPASPPPIQEAGTIFSNEVRAHFALADAANQYGVEPDVLMEVLRAKKPNTLDLAEFAKKGLTADHLDALREFLPAIDKADEVRAAMQTVFEPVTKESRGLVFKGMKDVPALRYSAEELAGGVRKLLTKLQSSTGAGADMAEVNKYLDQFIADHPGMLTPSEANKIKQFAQSASRRAIAGRTAGTRVAAESPNWQLFNDAIQQEIRGRLATDVAGLDAVNRETQTLLGLVRAFDAAERRGVPPNLNPANAALWYGLKSPQAMSRMALGAANPSGVAPAARAGSVMLQNLFNSTPRDATAR